MISLLDVNVLIAMIDTGHVHHTLAQNWFSSVDNRAWATCPITENGVLRIVGNPRYRGSPGTPFALLPILVRLRSRPDHHFLPDNISMADATTTAASLSHSLQVTDTYLVLLAQAHGARLATLDRRLASALIEPLRSVVELIV